jgi:hypothetical protein
MKLPSWKTYRGQTQLQFTITLKDTGNMHYSFKDRLVSIPLPETALDDAIVTNDAHMEKASHMWKNDILVKAWPLTTRAGGYAHVISPAYKSGWWRSRSFYFWQHEVLRGAALCLFGLGLGLCNF